MSKFVRTKTCVYHLGPVPQPAMPEVTPSVAHHILVLDRSGSMYYTIEELKKQVEHVLAVNAAKAGDVLPSSLASELVMYTPEKYAEVFEAKLRKAELEGTFYVADNGLLISIVPESCEYSTDLKAAAN